MSLIKSNKRNPVKLYPVYRPSKHVSDELISNVRKIIISYGGGIGGVNETLYVKRIFEGNEVFNDFWLVDLYTGERKYVNKKFVVSIDSCNLVEIVSNVTEHNYYNKEKHDKLYSFTYYEIPIDQYYEFFDIAHSNDAKKIISFLKVME